MRKKKVKNKLKLLLLWMGSPMAHKCFSFVFHSEKQQVNKTKKKLFSFKCN